jgi:hypothetical protein
MKRTPTEERAGTATIGDVLAQLEGEYFYDYATFTGSLREYVVRGLETLYESDPNELHRRAFVLNVDREEYSAYEDMGGFLDAFLVATASQARQPLEGIISYRPGQVRLDAVLERYKLATGDDLYDSLKLHSWMPSTWSGHHPNIDLIKVLRRACHFVVEDCGPGQRRTGVRAFNKIKHGLVLVPEGNRYSRKLPSAPAIIFETDSKDPGAAGNPVSILALPTEAVMLEERLRIIHFIQFTLRMVAMLYVLVKNPMVIAQRGLQPDSSVFGSERMADVLAFMQRSSDAPWSK